uniref:Uncharacterized protein n=1 Tax=viral metagenome TaxID=1070528 RepID=A0A6H2A3V8_9ZZZZ
MNKIIIPLPADIPRPRDVHSYDQSGELMGIQNVSDWPDEEVKQLVLAIQKRGDGSYAALKERSAP